MLDRIRSSSLVAVVAAFCIAASARADVLQTRYENALTVEPIDLLTGTFNLQYERALNPGLAAYVGINYLYFYGLEQPDSGTVAAVGPEVGLRFYLIGRAPAGLWIGPDIATALVRNRAPDGEFTESLGFSTGGMVGLNLVLDHFTASLGVGGNFYDYASYVGPNRIGLLGFELRERAAVGVIF
jgi:hypothetical protein